MANENIMLEREDGIAVLSINRSEMLDTLDKDAIFELMLIIKENCEDPSIDVFVVAGTEDRNFADIENRQDSLSVEVRSAGSLKQDVFRMIEDGKKPVFASVRGIAQSEGCELAMCREVLRGNICISMK